MSKRVVTAHVPADLAKRIDGLADRLDRPRGWVVKEALEAYVGLAEERHRETLAAPRAVHSGPDRRRYFSVTISRMGPTF